MTQAMEMGAHLLQDDLDYANDPSTSEPDINQL
jgi:hypothetical protein